MWIALNILRRRPEFAAAVAGRFEELLVDEAHDTSECNWHAWTACVRRAGSNRLCWSATWNSRSTPFRARAPPSRSTARRDVQVHRRAPGLDGRCEVMADGSCGRAARCRAAPRGSAAPHRSPDAAVEGQASRARRERRVLARSAEPVRTDGSRDQRRGPRRRLDRGRQAPWRGSTRQLELWEAATSGGTVTDDEERRVSFVALTRARRYCLVALPDTERAGPWPEGAQRLASNPSGLPRTRRFGATGANSLGEHRALGRIRCVTGRQSTSAPGARPGAGPSSPHRGPNPRSQPKRTALRDAPSQETISSAKGPRA